MRAGIEIEYTDGTKVEVSAIIPDFVAWERHTGRKASDLSTGMAVEDLAYLAYSAVTRGRSDRPTFDEWLGNVAALDPVETPVPKATRPVRSKD